MSVDESRYVNLIKPIKDLAANWDLDIAEELTAYLGALDNLKISLDGGATNLNFAEAALVIQGSAAAYSRKVEYLHQLVLQSLEFLTNKKSAAINPGKNKSENANPYDDESLLFGSDTRLLLVDYAVEMGQNIDLNMTLNQDDADKRRMSRNSGRFSMGSAGADVSRISISLMQSILVDDQRSSTLKLSSCVMDPSGALLIGGVQSSLAQMDTFSKSFLNQTASSLNRSKLGSGASNNREVTFQDPSLPNQSCLLQPEQSLLMVDDGDDWGGGDNGGGFDDDNEYDAGAAVLGTEPPQQNGTSDSSGGNSNNNGNRPLSDEQRRARQQAEVEAKMAKFYKQLDPHQVVAGSREYAKGRTFRLPPKEKARRLAEAKKKGKTSKNNEEEDDEEQELPAVEDYSSDAEERDLLRSCSQGPAFDLQRKIDALLTKGVMPLRGLFNDNLLGVLQHNRKVARAQKKAARKQEKLREENLFSGKPVNLDFSSHELLWTRDYDQRQPNNNSGSNANQLFQNFNGGGGEEDYPQQDDTGDIGGYDYDDGGDDNDFFDSAAVRAPEEDDDDEEDEYLAEERELAKRLENVLNEELVGADQKGNSYEAICRKHIANFMSGAEQYARETQLSRRVSEWTARLEPLLREQEEAPQFDIHDYSDQLLVDIGAVVRQPGRLSINTPSSSIGPSSGTGELITFGEVVNGRSSSEVCRVFLACLQLANLGNVEVVRANDEVDTTAPPETVTETKKPAASTGKRGKKASAAAVAMEVEESGDGKALKSTPTSAEYNLQFKLRLLQDLRLKSVEQFQAEHSSLGFN